MILFYLNVSNFSFFTDLRINQSILEQKTDFEMYYQNKKDIYVRQIEQNYQVDKVFTIPDDLECNHFQLVENLSDNSIDLYIGNEYGRNILIKDSFLSINEKLYYPILSDFSSNTISDFRDMPNRDWIAIVGFWAIEGLQIMKVLGKRKVNEIFQHYAFEVPWMFWKFEEVSILNDTELICIINDRIILLNIDTKEIALITKGNDYILKTSPERTEFE